MYEEKEPLKKEKVKKEKKESKFFQKKEKKEKVVKQKIKKEKTKNESNDTENKTKKIISFKADWTSILVKFGVFLLVAFFVIFGVTKIKGIGSKDTFTNNMEKMKEVAYTYYKVETHRPLLVNEEVSMKLEDMVEGSLIQELKVNKNVCSKEYSYVSMTKESDEKYILTVYLSCGGEAKSASYDVIYKANNNDKEDSDKSILYELERTVTTNEKYSCPEGYFNAGKNCVSESYTKTISATPKYRVIPEKNTAARYKASGYEYEYVDAIITNTDLSYKCSSGYDLVGDKCLKKMEPNYRTNSSYSCPNGSTPSGSRCLYTTQVSYSDEQAYCSKGHLINGNSCYIRKDYSVKCLTGKKDSSLNSCYTTYTAQKELSDWLFDSKVTYSSNYDPKDTETVMYEFDYENTNGKYVYKKYIKKYIKTCDEGDQISGNVCRHYDESYQNRYCSGDYHLANDKSECYTITSAKYRDIKGVYSCPSGYSKKGSGLSTICYKYETATKTTEKTPYCVAGYDLTQDNQCVKTVAATRVESEMIYTCPSGYAKRGNGAATTCYKKTTTDSYYYCTNNEATLTGTRCIIKAKTSFTGYSCPSGYTLYGSTCYQETRDHILATVNDGVTNTKEVIWSKEKDLAGWTWTGNTKEA